MKTIEITRGASLNVITLKNGDMYDSTLDVFDNKALIYHSDHVNTVVSKSKKGGMLAPVSCFGIVATQLIGKSSEPAIFLFNDKTDLRKIRSAGDLTLENRTFPSLVPNPNQGGKLLMDLVNFHRGGATEWNWSEGCPTMPAPYYWDFIKLFTRNEIMAVKLS